MSNEFHPAQAEQQYPVLFTDRQKRNRADTDRRSGWAHIVLIILLALTTNLVIAKPADAIEVYLFKGAGDFSFINRNLHFSRGLDSIAKELNEKGIRAEVRGFAQTGEAMRVIKQRRPKSVAFVGHSMGALASMSMASAMKEEGIHVAYVGTLDIPGPVGAAGSNVSKAENYFSIAPVYGLLTNTGSHKNAKNIHVLGTHTTMDDSKKVRNGIVDAILQIHANEGGYVSRAYAQNETAPSSDIVPDEAQNEFEVPENIPVPTPAQRKQKITAKSVPIAKVKSITMPVPGLVKAAALSVKDINQRIARAHVVKTVVSKIRRIGKRERPVSLLPQN